MQKRPSLGVCLISKNEEKNLPVVLESVRGIADEIYLTDTGSTDNTVEIAKSFECHISHFDWVNDFAKARNFNFDQAKTDYVLWIDCDDSLRQLDAFKIWRDNVMLLSDYWVATYNYTIANGRPVCSFARERVVKRSSGYRWRFPIHEGIYPLSQSGNIPHAQFAKSWWIDHRRSEEDLAKDKGRNLRVFESMSEEDKVHPRMVYYYGKELFEADRNEESIAQLGKAVTDQKLEPHDRILGFQYLCYAHIKSGTEQGYVTALNLAHTALMLSPQRAEFFTIIGDCYLKLGRLRDALPYFEAAKGCNGSLNASTQVIFTADTCYNVYPSNQIARIQVHSGRLDEAEAEIQEAVTRYDNPESRLIQAEIENLKKQIPTFRGDSQCDDIVMTCPLNTPFEWDGEIYRQKFFGGSETAAVEMAEWLHKLSGRKVIIFQPRKEMKVWEGVEYRPIEECHDYFDKFKPYFHIAWRHNIKMTNAPTFVWSHDLQTQGAENHRIYNKIMCLTPFHKNYMMVTQGVPEDKIYVTRNGLNPGKFTDEITERDPFKFVFSSSPDRGLDRAMRVLDRVREVYPRVHLHIHYGWDHLGKYGLSDLQKKLEEMAEERKSWVTYHGPTEQRELMAQFRSSAYCVQPSDFIETSKISALEMACSGVYQITRAVGGCVDTLAPIVDKGMATLVYSDCITEADHDLYAEEVIKAMKEDAYKRVLVDANGYAWENVARSWLKDLPEFF